MINKVLKKNSKYLFIIISISFIFFFVLFVVSFFKDTTKSLPVTSSAILNKKYRNTVSNIEIFDYTKQNNIVLKKRNNFWSGEENTITFPVDQKVPKNCLDKLTSIINMYKISDSKKYWKDFNLDNPLGSIKISGDDGTIFTEIYFGKLNFDSTSVYIRAGSNIQVYKVPKDLTDYISTSIRFWSDPYIIPKSLLNISESDIDRISFTTANSVYKIAHTDTNFEYIVHKVAELRHGEIEKLNSISLNKTGKLIIQTKDASFIHVLFYKNPQDTDFVLHYEYVLNKNDKSKFNSRISLLKYQTKISQWTFTSLVNFFKKTQS